MAGRKEGAWHPAGGDGHVEIVRQLDLEAGTPGGHPIRQVLCHALFERGAGRGEEKRIRVVGRQGVLLKVQKYILLSNRENLTLEGRKAPQTLLAANKRLNTAYLLKESFGQLWSYRSVAYACRFFDNWRAALKWQRLKPYEKFADMIERHWDGIAAFCKPENKVSLGFVEGLTDRIRVIQRRAYGLKDDEYLRLKVLTCMLPAI
jgi:transposase